MNSLQLQLRDTCSTFVQPWGNDDDACDVSVRHNYSGRGMYGDECVGIVGSMADCMAVIAHVIKAAAGDEHFEETVDQLLDFKTDSMGRDIILYWPNLPGIVQDPGIGQHYVDGCCPDCGDEIPLHKQSGHACDNCGHVFNTSGAVPNLM